MGILSQGVLTMSTEDFREMDAVFCSIMMGLLDKLRKENPSKSVKMKRYGCGKGVCYALVQKKKWVFSFRDPVIIVRITEKNYKKEPMVDWDIAFFLNQGILDDFVAIARSIAEKT